MVFIPVFLLIVVSIFAIGKGSDWLSDSLIPVARRMGVSGAAVGLILVSAAVSLPEILVAVETTLRGYGAISLGVVLGSIICNIGMMTGLSAMIQPLPVSRNMILRDGIFSIVVPILVFAVSRGGEINRVDGLAFFLLFITYVINVFIQERQTTIDNQEQDFKEVEIKLKLVGFDFGKLKPGWLSFALGLGLLLAGSQIFSHQLIRIAQQSGMDQFFLGITLGALVPSVPNIVTAIQATRKGMGEIAVSETLGSNIFTLLVTLGISAMLTPIPISTQLLRFDLPILVIMSFLHFFFILTGKKISRTEGFTLFLAYLAILMIQAFLNF